MHTIEEPDWTKLLTMKSSSHTFEIRQWKRLPCPVEWCILEMDRVEEHSSGKCGIVKTVHSSYVKVDLEDGSGLILWYWCDVLKLFKIGDYMEVMSGAAQGKKGWVVSLDTDIAHIIDESVTTMPSGSNTTVMPLNEYDIGFIYSNNKAGSVNRGACELSLVNPDPIQSHEFNPNHPFNEVELNYDNIVEATSQMKLLDYSKKKPPNIPPSYMISDKQSSAEPALDSSSCISSHEPAWNPNSRTLLGRDAPDSAAVATSNQGKVHPLLDNQLLHIKLKVNVHSGGIPGTQMAVWVDEQPTGALAFCCICNKVEGWLQLSWVHPRWPTPNRGDNSLMVVVEGRDCRKYIWHLSHQRDEENQKQMLICVVVNHEDGKMDTIMLQEIILDTDDVCLCWETKEEKELNKGLVKELNRQHRTV
ncbi:hypothetical protein BJ165DRAFT_1407835 [Panaeolus papilionaceus]|nr:hypothetical protein BJ165DRAFT_1407835 [Panaeolus papilionaceus]